MTIHDLVTHLMKLAEEYGAQTSIVLQGDMKEGYYEPLSTTEVTPPSLEPHWSVL